MKYPFRKIVDYINLWLLSSIKRKIIAIIDISEDMQLRPDAFSIIFTTFVYDIISSAGDDSISTTHQKCYHVARGNLASRNLQRKFSLWYEYQGSDWTTINIFKLYMSKIIFRYFDSNINIIFSLVFSWLCH